MSSTYVSVSPIGDSTPGFSFGRSGTANSGTYLQIDSVPSNLAGRLIPFTEATLSSIFVTCQNPSTFTVEVQSRSGNTFTTVYTATITNARTFSSYVQNVDFVVGDEIAVRIGSGSAQNIVVGLIIKGSSL